MTVLLTLAWGCAGSPPAPSPHTGTPGHSAAPPTAGTGATGHTAEPHSAAPEDTFHGSTVLDSGAPTGPTQTVVYRIWEWDRECWAERVVQRPIEYWEPYFAASCQSAGFQGRGYVDFDPYVDAGGHCVTWHKGFPDTPACDLIDPFIRPCTEVPECCDGVRADAFYELQCIPAAWEP